MVISENLLNRVVGNVILEYSGVSDKVLNISKEILRLMIAVNKHCNWDRNGDVLFKSFYLPIEGTEIKEIIGAVHVILYGFDSSKMMFKDALNNCVNDGLYDMTCSSKAEIIKIRAPYPINGELTNAGMRFYLSSINHEVKHALQGVMRGRLPINDAYLKSLDKNGLKNDKGAMYLMKYYIKTLYYYFDIIEVDAHLQEIYIQLCDNGGKLHTCEVYNDFKRHLDRFEWIIDLLECRHPLYRDKEYVDIKNNFDSIVKDMLGNNMSGGKFLNHCRRGIRRFNEHLRRVVGRHRNENMDNANVGSFGNYTKNEILQDSPFKKSAWDSGVIGKMKRKYNNLRNRIKYRI